MRAVSTVLQLFDAPSLENPIRINLYGEKLKRSFWATTFSLLGVYT